ncbi:hypothetical protein AYK26_04010 [Euryarchaeota archaeon SM23-78]|nr:MAG: hypothetical protein AYK26_04010 [Euryarchaeota archaeon SM23-78]
MELKAVLVLLFFIIGFNSVEALLFYEPFNNISTIQDNNGSLLFAPIFCDGVLGNALNLSNSKKVCYPLENNFNDTNGTLEFWVKPPSDNGLGFFDINGLMNPNSQGIFKNLNYAIMEVKNNVNNYDQAWSPKQLVYDDEWHFIAAVWERRNITTYFKLCLDGECKSDYDGNIINSYPDLSQDFCVGWNRWYGYSESLFDELKIFEYAKSNQEIHEDYLSYVNQTQKECIMYKPESTGPVKINCSGLFVNNQSFKAKGVGYQPIPIGLTADVPGGTDIIYDSPEIYNRDFPLLREMNANTIRTWGKVTNTSFLDAAYNNGVNPIYVVMGFWINCYENYGDPAVRQNYIDEFTLYVNEFKDHPAVLVWALGNENNLDYCSNPAYIDDFYSLCNELARVAYEIEGSDYHPIGVVNGDLLSLGSAVYASDDASMNYTDFWGCNVFRGKSFGSFFYDYAALTGKPLLITEYGIDALNNTNYQEYEDVHADWVLSMWSEINNSNITIGSTLMAYSDEWWKTGNHWSHDYGGYPTGAHPDGFSNEEWWGVMRIALNASGGPDIMQPRMVYYELKDAFYEEKQVDINLFSGWNLISLPLQPTNTFVSAVIKDLTGQIVVWHYNASNDLWTLYDTNAPFPWLNTLHTMSYGNAYWLKSESDQTLTVQGDAVVSHTIRLMPSWNFVGYNSSTTAMPNPISGLTTPIIVWTYHMPGADWRVYDTEAPFPWLNSLKNMTMGRGYWLKSDIIQNWSI